MTYLHPTEYAVIPKQWVIVKHKRVGDVVAAMMPYPGPDDQYACAGDEAYTKGLSSRDGITQAHVQYMRDKCGRCPVLEACREYGIAHESFGMWGGLTEADRKVIRRERGQVMVEPHLAHEYGMGDEWFAMLNLGKAKEDWNSAEDQAD